MKYEVMSTSSFMDRIEEALMCRLKRMEKKEKNEHEKVESDERR